MALKLDELFRSPDYLHMDKLDFLSALLAPEFKDKVTKTINNRLRTAHIIGTPCEITSCKDSKHRRYEPTGAPKLLSSLRFIEDGRVLMTNYADYDKKYKEGLGNEIKEALEAAGFDVVSLSYLDKFDYGKDKTFRLLFKHTWCYINYLQVGKRILVPSLGYGPLDQEAVRQIDQAFNARKHIADVSLIDVDMTTIVDDIGAEENSGGGLNCLTWTIGA